MLLKLLADQEALEIRQAERLSAVQKLGGQAGELEEEVAACRRRLEALHARQDLLSRMQEDLAGFYEGVRAVLKAGMPFP